MSGTGRPVEVAGMPLELNRQRGRYGLETMCIAAARGWRRCSSGFRA